MSADFIREVRAYPAFDHRDEPGDQRGCGSFTLSWILRGPLGAISADVDTGWMLRPYTGTMAAIHAPKPLAPRGKKPGLEPSIWQYSPRGAGVHSHCLEQRRDYWTNPRGRCTILDSDECWGDTGYLVSDQFVEALVGEGDEGAWRWLRECYDEWLPAEVPS